MQIEFKEQQVTSDSTVDLYYKFASPIISQDPIESGYTSPVGVTSVLLSYGPEVDHHVEAISFGMTTLESVPSTEELVVPASVDMTDKNSAASTRSALLGVLVQLENGPATAPGLRGLSIHDYREGFDIPVPPGSEVRAIIGGVSASYGSGKDHHVKTFGASVDIKQKSSDRWELSVDVTLKDNSSNSGSGSVWASLIVWPPQGSPIHVSPSVSVRGGSRTSSHVFNGLAAPLNQALLFLKSFNLTYGDEDHHVSTITIMLDNATVTIDNQQQSDGTYTATVSFDTSLEMEDKNGNNKASNSSDTKMELYVVGVEET